MLGILVREARQPTLEEVLARAAARPKVHVSADEIVAMIREDRDSR